MNCQEYTEHLSAYHDGELTETLRVRVAAHTAQCSECHAKLESFGEVSALLAASRRATLPPAGIWDRIEASATKNAHALPSRQGPWRSFLPRVAAVMIGFVAYSATAGFLGWLLTDGASVMPLRKLATTTTRPSKVPLAGILAETLPYISARPGRDAQPLDHRVEWQLLAPLLEKREKR